MKKFINPDWKALRKLESSLKQAWFYIWDKSDAAGVYEFDTEYFNVDNGFSIQFNELLKIPNVVKIADGKVLLTDYIEVNFVSLKEGYNPHKPTFRALDKHNLFLNSSLNQACFKLEYEEENKKEDKKEKEKKPRETKSTVPNQLFLDVYNDFLKSRTGTTEQFSVQGRTALQKIILYLREQVKNSHPNLDGDELNKQNIQAWKYVLHNYEKWDSFHQKQLKLEQINSNLINIISSIKNGNTKQNNGHGSKQRFDAAGVAAEAHAILRNKFDQSGQTTEHPPESGHGNNGGEGDFTDYEVLQ
jgi:hypothetical protein